jgi:hypothetical protein
MVRLAQQQLSSSAAGGNTWTPLTHLLTFVRPLLCCWNEMVHRVPALLQVVVRTLLPLVQQLQSCGSLLMRPAAATHSAAAAGVHTGSSSDCQHPVLQCALFDVQQAASALLTAIDLLNPLDAQVATEVLRLQNDPAVAELQLQLLTAWTAQLHQQHSAQQLQQLPPGTAAASSSSTQQQQRQQQQHRADLLSIPAFYQDMLQLLPGGQAYLVVAAEAVAGWGLVGEAKAVQLRAYAGGCCNTISRYLSRHLASIAGQQQISRSALVVSGAAVRLAMALQLLASGAVQRQRAQQRQQQQRAQQQQQAPASTADDQTITDLFALQTWDLLRAQIKALAVVCRSCLPPEVLQQAGLQLLQALAALPQQWQLSRSGNSFLQDKAVVGVLPQFDDTLDVLVTAACGAQALHSHLTTGEYDQWCSSFCLPDPQLLHLCILLLRLATTFTSESRPMLQA